MKRNGRVCTECGKTKPGTAFYFRDATQTLRRLECKECRKRSGTRSCQDQLSQIGIEICALFPGELAIGIRNGQLIADVTCRLLREHAGKAAVA